MNIQSPAAEFDTVNQKESRLSRDPGAVARYDEAVLAHFIGVTLQELGEEHCRYPKGDGDSVLYCGQPKLLTSSFCARCHLRCWQPAQKRKA